MRAVEDGFDKVYFSLQMSWRRRLHKWLAMEEQEKAGSPFTDANADIVAGMLADSETGIRMVFNIPADALLGFLRDGRYKNAYELPSVGGRPRGPSERRQQVDQLLGFKDKPERFYFGAVEFKGAGVRFYGEYCLVLDPEKVCKTTQVLDRNSYDLIRPPLLDVADKKALARVLKGRWAHDLVDMLTLKILPELRNAHRLVTTGIVSEGVLCDEEFVEAHRRGSFRPEDIEEVRTSPAESILENEISKRYRNGQLPSPEEIIWMNRRAVVTKELREVGMQVRTVLQTGREGRWR